MFRPPKPPEALIDKTTHHSIEVSWEPYLLKLQAKVKPEVGRLRVELQSARAREDANWEVAYRGHDGRSVLSDLADDCQYQLRYRFGGTDTWGDFSNPQTVRTNKKPFTGEDLHRQLRIGSEDAMRKILETGEVSPDVMDDKGFTPITVAALADKLHLCDLLLEFGADINCAAENGKTSLMLVACKGKPSAARWLLENGAGLSQRDRRGMTALHFAVDGEQAETVRLLLQNEADLHARDNQGCTPLIRCAMLKNNGNTAVAGALIRQGAKLDETDASGQSALFYCAINQHLKMATLLLEHGADPYVTNAQGLSVVKVAESQDRKGMTSLIAEFVNKKKNAAHGEGEANAK